MLFVMSMSGIVFPHSWKIVTIYVAILGLYYASFVFFQKVDHLSGPCYQLVDYPAPGFVFQLPENRSVVDLAR